MRNLYRFFWDCGRMGDVEGLFVATPEEVDKNIGRIVYFGEILGKHSEITGSLDEEDLEIVSSDQDFINKLVDILGTDISGYNPLDNIEDLDDEEEE